MIEETNDIQSIDETELDLDLEPEFRVRKSRAEFCIKSGEISMLVFDFVFIIIRIEWEFTRHKKQIKLKIFN